MEAVLAIDVPAADVRDRLFGFAHAVTRPLPLRRQRENAPLYVRGLVEHRGRKSLQPTLFRLEETPARYESLQQVLAVSAWGSEALVRACAEGVAPRIGVVAWVVDDTGIVKDGRHSPGVKRQYSGTLGKIGNCQVAVSVHAVGERGTLPLGWRLYLPEEWCDELERRRGHLRDALGQLGTRERDIVVKRRLEEEPQSLQDLGRHYGISRERVRQIEREVMSKLRNGERADRLRSYAS